MHYTGITCITSNYTHPTATSRQIVGFIRTVYAVPRRVLAAKGGIADPDQPCHSTFGPPPSSHGSQLVGRILRCLEPLAASRVHTTESAGPWIPWAPLRLILQVLMPSKRPPGPLAAYTGTFGERDVVEYYLLMFVATSSILSPLSYDMSARSHPAMYLANDLERLVGPSMRSARPLPPSQRRKSFRGSGNAARGSLARQAAAALLYASGPACSAAHNLPSNRDGSPEGAAGRGGWGGGGRIG